MKKHLCIYLLATSFCLMLIVGYGSSKEALQNSKNRNVGNIEGIIDSFLVSMDEYRIIDTRLNDKIDSLFLSVKEDAGSSLSGFPIFITIKPFEKQGYTLFAFGVSKAYALEFAPPGDQLCSEYGSLVSDPGFGALFYKGHLLKLGGLPKTYEFIDQDGKEKPLIEATKRRLSFYAYIAYSDTGTCIVDLAVAQKHYYKFRNGNFFFHVSTD